MQLQRPLVSALSLSMAMLLLLSPSVTSQNTDLIPEFCETRRPSKSSENCVTERRYFLHATKGCKAFAICQEQTAELDAQTGINYFVSREDCRIACVQGIVCPELTAPANGSVMSDGFMNWGGTVEYSCNEGYALVGFKDRTCTREATWSNSEPTCEKQCPPPPKVDHASVGPVHNYYDKGTRIFYTCEEGYTSQVVERTCESGGVWSGPEPVCEFQMKQCPEPELIHNGRIFVPDRSVGQTVTYICDEDFILIGNATRTCGEDARWQGDAPICWKLNLEYSNNTSVTDITNRTLTLAIDTRNACVEIESSHPDPLPDVVPVWYFNDEILREMEYPHGVELGQRKLTFTRVLQSKEQEGNYTMKLGPYSISFRLTVDDAVPTTTDSSVIKPNIFVSPSHVEGSLGESVRFSCAFTGCPPPNVTWFHNDSAISPGGRLKYTVFPSHSLTVCHLDITDVSYIDVGSYKCVGENPSGVDSSDAADLRLNNVVSTNARRKRSMDDASSWHENSLCEQVSDPESVTILARPRKELRRVRSSKQLRNYRFEVSKVLKGTLQSSSSSSSQVGKRRQRVAILDSTTKLHLNSDEQYILTGRMSDSVMYVSGPQHIHHFTTELENHIQSC